MKELIAIQSELKAPKNQFNKFGKYNYRSQEDILEALKPLLKKYNCILNISDETKEVAGIPYVNAMAMITNSDGLAVCSTAQAGIEKGAGMSLAQSFGASSSYARKYALNGLFLIDDTKDADSTNTHGKEEETPTKGELDELRKLVYSGKFDSDETRDKAFQMIAECKDYQTYQKLQCRLEQLQPSLDEIPNPSQADIKRELEKKLG